MKTKNNKNQEGPNLFKCPRCGATMTAPSHPALWLIAVIDFERKHRKCENKSSPDENKP